MLAVGDGGGWSIGGGWGLGRGGEGLGGGWLALCLHVCAIVARSLERSAHFSGGGEGGLQRVHAFEAV